MIFPPCSVFRIPYSVFRIPYSVFRIPYSVFRIPYSVFRIPYSVFRRAATVRCALCAVRCALCDVPLLDWNERRKEKATLQESERQHYFWTLMEKNEDSKCFTFGRR